MPESSSRGDVCSGGCQLPGGGGVCSGVCLLLGGVFVPGGGRVSAPRVGSAPGGCLLLGVSAPRGVCSQGGVCSGGVCFWGGCMSAPRGVPAPGGFCSQGVSAPGGCGIPACTEADTPLWTESQMPVKTLPWPNFVAAGNNNGPNIGDGLNFMTSEQTFNQSLTALFSKPPTSWLSGFDWYHSGGTEKISKGRE